MVCPAWSDMPFDITTDAVFVISSTPLSVRHALREILRHPFMAHQSMAVRGNAEVVLAEILNNIVKHAYADASGQIDLRLQLRPYQLFCEIVDCGIAMPSNKLPEGLVQPTGVEHDLPEGGFGWFLIRSLTKNMVYRRVENRNHLSFQLNFEQ